MRKIILLKKISKKNIQFHIGNIPGKLDRHQRDRQEMTNIPFFLLISTRLINTEYISEYIHIDNSQHIYGMVNNVNQCWHKFWCPMMTSRGWQDSRKSSWSPVSQIGFALFSEWNIGSISCTWSSASLLPHLETKKNILKKN